MSGLLLRRVAALDPSGSFDGPVDVQVSGGAIVAVGKDLASPEDATDVDCDGLFLMPGVTPGTLYVRRS